MALKPPTRSLKSRPITFTFDIPIGKTDKFWETLEKEGQILATKCNNCGALSFPPVASCTECLSSEVGWIPVAGEGEIETFTHVVIKPTSFQNNETYTVVVGKLRDGLKVLAWLKGVKMNEVKVGMKVKLVSGRTPEGSAIYNFVPL
jgi:uncharacterized OB-fold protein